jgi:hypothetical protein
MLFFFPNYKFIATYGVGRGNAPAPRKERRSPVGGFF